MRDLFLPDKFQCQLPPSPEIGFGRAPLAAMVVLASDDTPRVQRLKGSEVLPQLQPAACYCPQMLDLMNLGAEQTGQWLQALQTTAVYQLERPRYLARLYNLPNLLERL